ncbi:hypothetical protein [Streptomyces sp. NPDC047973]|uniref:hypothetical protein n=1 Tax=Streptomyces sp. NPDC047973 TaxID=3155383 RepID=UPI0034123546
MLTENASGDSRLSLWLRVREIAVPPLMIETATARRIVGDWAGACAAAGFDVDLDLRAVARVHGRGTASRLRADLRLMAPDLLRWHMPRTAPDGLLQPGTTAVLARYDEPGSARPMRLVARTTPAWADAGQRISLAVWDGRVPPGREPRPRGYRAPDARFRLDLHRHLWDASRSGELRERCGASGSPVPGRWAESVPDPERFALGRWASEAALLLEAEGRADGGEVAVRLGARRRLLLDVGRHSPGAAGPDVRSARLARAGAGAGLPVLPHAATWALPDLELLRSGLLPAGRLHPLVASALAPGVSLSAPAEAGAERDAPRLVDCRGSLHRIGLVDGALIPLDHDPAEIRREELLAALSGTPLPCLRAIDSVHRGPDWLTDVRDRLAHGDTTGALALVGSALGEQARLRDGELSDALHEAARQGVRHGLFRAGLAAPAFARKPLPAREPSRPPNHPHRPRLATTAR